MNRREFIGFSAGYTGCALFLVAFPNVFFTNAFARKGKIMIKTEDLLHALERNDTNEAVRQLKKLFDEGHDPWEIHLLLFPIVQRVLNPPFINPHLPKVYAITRELVPYLRKEDIPPLIRLEVTEYTRRSKLEKPRKAELLKHTVSFSDIESAIREQDREKTATLIATFHSQAGKDELTRRLLFLGSGYLSDSLGHSISCTAFILQEMSARKREDLWPAFATLADYFCKGRFHNTPGFGNPDGSTSADSVPRLLLQTTKGGGIVNLHHTITLYAMERVRYLFNKAEYRHMMSALTAFMGKKDGKHPEIDIPGSAQPTDYSSFNKTFSGMDARSVTALAMGMIPSSQGRRQLGRFLIKSLCEAYEGDYDPHYITGLGSALWAIDRYWNQDSVAMNALYQYLDYLFNGLRSTG
jgi:hypothetical protein